MASTKRWTKIALGIPIVKDNISFLTTESLFNLDREGLELTLLSSGSPNLAEKRNQIVYDFLDTDAEALLFVDDDMVLPPHTVSRLASWRLPIVGALCTQRFYPYAPTAYMKSGQYLYYHTNIPDSRPFLVDSTGTGCLMVRREVFEKIEYPWFDWPELMKDGGEDTVFCDKAKFEGEFPIYVDSGVIVGHIGQVISDIYLHRKTLEEQKEPEEKMDLEELGFE